MISAYYLIKNNTNRTLKWIFILIIPFVWGCNPYSHVTRYDRTINFSGIEWVVKGATEPVGPGPNWFNDAPDNVWVDSMGNLHLKIHRVNDKWTCAEVVTKDVFGYGRYFFQVISELDELDPSIVFGLFTWSNRGVHNKEIDVEFSKWGDPDARYNAQYVIQPAHVRGNRYRFPLKQEGSYTTHQFSWYPRFINFYSFHGHVFNNDQEATPIKFWVYPKRFGKPRKVHIRMNLWLNKGEPPTNEEEAEVIIRKFRYEPIE